MKYGATAVRAGLDAYRKLANPAAGCVKHGVGNGCRHLALETSAATSGGVFGGSSVLSASELHGCPAVFACEALHRWLGDALMRLAGFHAVAAIFHALVLKERRACGDAATAWLSDRNGDPRDR